MKKNDIPENVLNNWKLIVELMADIMGSKAALINLIEGKKIQVIKTNETEENPFNDNETYKLAGLYCEEVVNKKEKLEIKNALKDKKWEKAPEVDYDLISYLGYPIINPEGKVFGTICVLDDKEREYKVVLKKLLYEFKLIIENQLKEIELNKRLMSFKNLVQSILDSLTSHIAVLDDKGNIKYTNEAWKRFALENGLHNTDKHIKANYLDVCYNAEGEFSEQASQAAEGIKKVIEGKKDLFTLEYPCHSPEEKRWFMLRATPFRGQGDYAAVISHVDITRRKLKEEEANRQRIKLKKILETTMEGFFILNKEGKFIETNQAFLNMIKYSEEKLLDMYVNQIDINENYEQVKKHLARIKEKGSDSFETRFKCKDDSEIFVEISTSYIENPEGQEYAVFVRDITKRKKEKEKIKYYSFHDQLTGIYNRRYFEQELERMDKSRRLPITIIIADLDGLKNINDTYGHKIGDKYIKKTADLLKAVTREEDIVARIGGDEFAVILPETDHSDAHNIKKRFHKKCEICNKNNNLPEPITISIGYSTLTDDSKNLNDIFKEADNFMYKEKDKNKKNKIR